MKIDRLENCKWRDDFTWICFNGDSEMCADVADDEYAGSADYLR